MASIAPKQPKPKTGPQSDAKPGGPGLAAAVSDIPGFTRILKNDYKTHLEMLEHPTIALAYAITTKPIERSSWGWNRKDGVPEDREKFIADLFDPMHSQITRDALKAVVMGWAPFELVWQGKKTNQIVQLIKPLAWEKTEIRCDPWGNFAGLENRAGDKPVILDTQTAWAFTYDPWCGNLYGRSRLRNILKWYARGEEVAGKFAQYLRKMSGIIFQLHYPDGTSKDAAGADRPNWWLAADLLEKVAQGQSVAMVNKFASMMTVDGEVPAPAIIEKALAAAGMSDWVFSFLDPKGPDLTAGFLDTLAYIDKLYFRGFLRPERTALEANRGGIGHGDAEQHSEVGMLDTESLAWDLTRSFNLNVVDQVLVANWGEDARGSVWAEPAPLIDTTMDNALKIIETGLANPQIAQPLAAQIGWEDLLADIEIPIAGAPDQAANPVKMPQWSVAAALKNAFEQSQQVKQQQPAAPAVPPKKGKGQKVAKMSRAAVRRAERALLLAGGVGAAE